MLHKRTNAAGIKEGAPYCRKEKAGGTADVYDISQHLKKELTQCAHPRKICAA